MKSFLFITITAVLMVGCQNLSNLNTSDKKAYRNEKIETLPNGLKIYFIQDNSLPLIDIQLLIPVGAFQQPKGQEGLASLTARVLDKGTHKKGALEIADAIADAGSDFSASVGHDFSMLSTQALVTQLDVVLELSSEILFYPTFPQEEIDREKQQMLVQLKSKQDRSGSYADTLFYESFFKGHPYGLDLLGTPQTLQSIDRKAIVDYYKKYYQPRGARLAVSGKLTPEIEEKIRKQFSNWIASATYEKPNVTFRPLKPETLNQKVDSPHKAQTEIRIAFPGIARSNKDFLALRVINEVLGGSFASRLNQRVRDDLGLTYSIHSYVDARDQGGMWAISTFTKNETSEKTVAEIKNVISQLLEEGIQESELEAAKNLVKAQLPRALETSDKLAYNLIALDFYGVSRDYLFNFNQDVDRMTVSQLNSVMRKYLRLDEMRTFVFSTHNPPLTSIEKQR